MIVRQAILEKVNKPLIRSRIAVALGVGEQTVAMQMRNNTPDGRLTKMDALQAIAKEVGCGIEEILEAEEPAVIGSTRA